MSKINTPRLILGGLVAGLVANVLDVVANGMVMFEDMDLARQRLGIDTATWESLASMVTWIAVDVLLGFLIVFIYVAIRPRFGPGPQTAVIAGLVPYVAVTAVMVGFSQMGIFTPDVMVKAAILSLVTMLAASLAGARVYQEADA